MAQSFFKAKTLKTVVFGALLAAFFIGCSGDSPHVKRGREMLSIGEFEDATKEFKLALKDNPKDVKAKALFFYAQSYIEEEPEVFYTLVSVFMYSEAEKEKLVDKEELDKLKLELRNDFYDYGLETKDWKELVKIAEIAGKEAFAQEDTDEDEYLKAFKIIGATITGKLGDTEAVEYLLRSMKDFESVWLAYTGLLAIGKSAIKPLEAELTNKESLFREQAERVLYLLRTVNCFTELKKEIPKARPVREKDVSSAIYEEYFDAEGLYTLLPRSGAIYIGDYTDYTVGIELPEYSFVSQSKDTLKPEEILFVYGMDPEHADDKFFAVFYQWNADNGKWERVELHKASGSQTTVFSSEDPIVYFKTTDEGYILATASTETQTLYRTETDYSTYPPTTRRVPYEKEGIFLDEIKFKWSDALVEIVPPKDTLEVDSTDVTGEAE